MSDDDASFQLLGPLEVRLGDRIVHLSPLERDLVAALALSANTAVSLDRIVDLLWSDAPPSSARNRVQTLVSTLRRALGAAAPLVTTSSGYRLDLRPGQLDLDVFGHRVADARELAAAGRLAAAGEEFRSALALWCGDPLGGVSGQEAEKARLRELRLAVLDERIATDLALGRHADLIGELTALLSEHRTREPFAAKLMLALYRSGRQADALDTYARLRTHLVDELGLDPGRDVAELHARILRRDATLDLPSAAPAAPGPPTRPAQLPRDLPDFVGRATEFAQLLADIDTRERDGRAVVISAIDGMAGVGKTVLAIRAAHRLSEWYPDGQLFLDLHAHTAGQAPLAPATALDSLLRALGVPSDRIPPTVDERAALWRSELADRRVLVVLDNAIDAAQVRPLLPGSPGCLVLVTTRRRLADLEGAQPLVLDVLPRHDAVALFAAIAGDRAGQEPDAVADVVELCGRLPLAIRLAAGRLRHRPLWTVAHLVDRLRDERRRLAELSSPERSVAAAFTLSYQDLDADQSRMFRLLGLHPGVDVDPYAAAGLADVPLAPAEDVLESLLDVHLLQQRALGRYTFHDLLRDHARDRAEAEVPAPVRRDALGRLLDHYLHTAGAAMDLFAPQEKDRRPQVPMPTTATPTFPDAAHATRWLGAERRNLVASGARAARGGWVSHATRLSTVLWRYLDISGLHAEALALHTDALDAARASGDREAEADALNLLGIAYEQLNRYPASVDAHQSALAIYRDIGHRAGEGNALNKLGIAYDMLVRYGDSLDAYRQALAIRREIGDRDGEAGTLQNLSYACRLSGRYAEARGYLLDSLVLHRDAGNRYREGVSLFQLGLIGKQLGDYPASLDHYGQALAISREIGDRSGEGNALNGAGQVYERLGRYADALDRYEQALEIRREIGDLRTEALTLVNLGTTYAATGRYDEAADHLRRAYDQCQRIDQHLLGAEASNGLGIVARLTGRYRDALDHHERARDAFREGGQQLGEAEALTGLGEAHLAGGAPDMAVGCLTEALAQVQRTGDRYEQARAHAGLAGARAALGHPELAEEHARTARTIQADLGAGRTGDPVRPA